MNLTRRTPLKSKKGFKNIQSSLKRKTADIGSTHGQPIQQSGLRSGFSKPRKKMRQVSKRRAEENKIYSELRKAFLAEHPQCAVFPYFPATEIHHKKKRGRNFLNVETWIAVSSAAHRWIHDNPAEARAKGLIENSWK